LGAKVQSIPRLLGLATTLLPTVLALRTVAPTLTGSLTVFAGCLLGAALLEGAVRQSRTASSLITPALIPAAALFAVSLLMLIQAAVRGVVPVTTILGTTLMLVGPAVLGILWILAPTPRDRALVTIMDGLGVLIVTSTLLYFAGVKPVMEWSAGTGSMGTFGIARVNMPLTLGATSHSAICGAVLLTSVFSFRRANFTRRLFSLITLASSIFGLLITDGRMAMAATLLVLAIMPLPIKPVLAKLTPYLAALFAVSAPLFLFLIQLAPPDLLEAISRSGSAAEITSGNMRVFVWERIATHMMRNPIDYVFGYGLLGQGMACSGKGHPESVPHTPICLPVGAPANGASSQRIMRACNSCWTGA